MKTKISITIIFSVLFLFFAACTDDLNVRPLNPNITTDEDAYKDEEGYIKGLMKIYSVLAMSGQDGDGSTDIEGLDAGNAQLLRAWWVLQVISTDESINSWVNDEWTTDINEMRWNTTKCEPIEGVYQRCMFMIALANEYIRQSAENIVDDRGITAKDNVAKYRLEARYLRALAYYILMDAFGRPPFITEDNRSTTPSQLSRADLFNWIEGELKELATTLPPARQNGYGRADQGAINALLARMYLNAEVYTGTARYTDCITACKAVISSGYRLASDYANLFKADNNITAGSEMIFPVLFDGAATKSWGGMTFIICASRGGTEVDLQTDGVSAGWAGNSTLRNLVEKFEFSNPNYAEEQDAASILDKRGIFKADGRSLDVESWPNGFMTQGWAVYKYTNVTSTGAIGSDAQFPDTDFPFFRLGEIYLTYAEAVVRGGQGGSINDAVTYINDLRTRGYGNTSGNKSAADLTLDFLLAERAREVYWEATRRTDLVRFGKYTSGDYVWPFKGGSKSGSAIESHKDVFPIPATDLTVNSNLTQNDGYRK